MADALRRHAVSRAASWRLMMRPVLLLLHGPLVISAVSLNATDVTNLTNVADPEAFALYEGFAAFDPPNG
jgi:hypothetical protein